MKASVALEGGAPVGCAAALPPTRWSVVARACDQGKGLWLDALNDIVRQYRPVFIRYLMGKWRMPPDRADELVQEFLLAKMSEKHVLGFASQAKGRLRSFLMTVFDHFVTSYQRKQRALKRRPSSPDSERLDDLPEMTANELSPAEVFEVIWARQILDMAVSRMEEACVAGGRQGVWDIFYARTLRHARDGMAPMPYSEIVARFKLSSCSEASNRLVTANRMFAQNVREVVLETIDSPEDVERELLELKRILERAGEACWRGLATPKNH